MTNPFNVQPLHEWAFGIVDAAMVAQIPDGVKSEPLVPKKLTQSAHLMPTLIDLRRTPIDRLNLLHDCLNEACENGEAPAVALFIKTDSSATEIVRHWNAMQIAEPQRGRKLWLRLHDPRVLHQVLRVLGPTQRRKLFGTLLAFTYWIGGEWITAERGANRSSETHSPADSRRELYGGPERWDWLQIERISLVNRALHRTSVQSAALLTSAGASAEQLIKRATERYGLVEHADLVEFAIRGLSVHPTFDEHPSVAPLIQPDASSPEQSSLSDRFALVEQEVWNALRQPI